MSAVSRPQPEPTDLTVGFWAAAREGRLVVQRCTQCALLRHYPQHLCPDCHSGEWAWTQVAGTGEIYSFSVAHRAFHPAWADRVPYAVVTVELDEGIRMVSDLPVEDTADVAIGRRVEVFFDETDDEWVLPRFRLSPPHLPG